MATKNALSGLHDKLAKVLKEQLEDGVRVLNKDGEVETIMASAATLNVVRQFLRDNGIETDPDQPSEPMENLGKAMDLLTDDDNGLPEFVN